ncbi:MAG TPA: TIGR03118 family protein [Candidatus Bathyarchaeia archaeon]|nr:TIGR03118 family protein [Candidatus Bathyarchaeia archaeon]
MINERSRGGKKAIVWLGLCCAVLGSAHTARANFISVTNLVTDDQSVNAAQLTDPFLKNAWGISHSSTSPFWVSDNGAGVTTLYTVNPTTNATTKVTLGAPPDPSGGVVIPPGGSGNPTGQAFNSAGASAFNGDAFLFVSEDGTISGWRAALGTTAEILQSPSVDNVYKGTTAITTGGHSYLLSANFRTGTIDVFKGDSAAPDLAGRFVDPNLPSGYAPFNIQVLGGVVYVTYALQDSTKHDDDPGAGHGFVDAFDLQGSFLGRIGTMGTLNSPWGLALAPASFTGFAGDLLVGNFGDGTISAFSADPVSPGFLGQLTGADGKPIAIDGLWGLIAGNDGNGGSSQKIYFAAGPSDESNGLFGVLQSVPSTQSVPEPSSMVLELAAIGLLAGRWAWKRHRSPVTAGR